MQAVNFKYNQGDWISQSNLETSDVLKGRLVLAFGQKEALCDEEIYRSLKERFTAADIIICSTSGEIIDDCVELKTTVATSLYFEYTRTQAASVNIRDFRDSYEAGKELYQRLPSANLTYILLISDGSLVNGTGLLKAMNEGSGGKVLISGGMAGDGLDFKSTVVGLNSVPEKGNIVAVGFYGDRIEIACASKGGWKEFGDYFEITKSESNKVYEINNIRSTTFYNQYFGGQTKNLPASRSLYPLSLSTPDEGVNLIRGVLSANEESGVTTFAGDLPVGSKVRFAKASFSDLIDAAENATKSILKNPDDTPQFILVISCVARRIVLGPGSDEEVKAVKSVMGKDVVLSGFYSYGEFSPSVLGKATQLHNQTITLTSFSEK